MRIAVIADIHGNAPALEAVIAQLRNDAPDLVFNLGDCLSGPLWPRETADILMAQNWPTVRGNHDRYLTDLSRDEMGASDVYAHDQIGDHHRAWLRALPPTLRRDDTLLFHAQPGRDDAYLLERVTDQGNVVAASASHIEARLRGERAPLILCGHTHLPRAVQVHPGALIVNPGSIGCPGYQDDAPVPHKVEVGSPHARYAVATKRGGDIVVDLRIVAYDWERAAEQARRNNRPDWARSLATGYLD